MKFTLLLLLTTPVLSQTIIDIDNNLYNTITIGNQTWLKENLKTTHFSNGDLIPTTVQQAINDSTSIYRWAYNNDVNNVNDYGLLYTWFVVKDSRNVCPVNWHVPAEQEWIDLGNYLGGDSIAGDKLKETGTVHWLSTTGNVSNSSDFTALPGGFRGNPSGFINLGNTGNFWTSTPWGSDAFQRALTYQLSASLGMLIQSLAVANCGLSLRCIKDLNAVTRAGLPENNIPVYPNPAHEKLYISLDETGNFYVRIYSASGDLFFVKQMNEKAYSIDIQDWPKGMYSILISSAKSIMVKKVIIE